jgi:hypothetical protein
VARRGLLLAVAGAVVLTVLTAATGGGGGADADGGQAPAMTRLGAGPSQDSSASSPAPGFLLDDGRYTPVAIPPHLAATAPQGIVPTGINDRGQIVGAAMTPATRSSPHPTDTPPMGRTA